MIRIFFFSGVATSLLLNGVFHAHFLSVGGSEELWVSIPFIHKFTAEEDSHMFMQEFELGFLVE